MEWRKLWRMHGRICRTVLVGMLVLLSTASARAQEADDGLQGRLLQRSDGALFIYKDGFKYPVAVADIGDDAINALPDGDAQVAGLPDLFPTPPPAAPVIVVSATAMPPVPGPYVAVSNPTPGDNVSVGGLNMQGKAFDPMATTDQGSGIDRVQIFLEDRGRGGLHLAEAPLGVANSAAAPGSQFAFAGWEAIVNLPGGAHTLFVYARSWVTTRESVVQVPIRVGT